MSQRVDSDLMRVFESFATFGDRCVIIDAVSTCRDPSTKSGDKLRVCVSVFLRHPIPHSNLPFQPG